MILRKLKAVYFLFKVTEDLIFKIFIKKKVN